MCFNFFFRGCRQKGDCVVMHGQVRTVPFSVKRMRSRVNHNASSSVHNEMNRVNGHTRGREKRRINQRGSTADNGIQGTVSVAES